MHCTLAFVQFWQGKCLSHLILRCLHSIHEKGLSSWSEIEGGVGRLDGLSFGEDLSSAMSNDVMEAKREVLDTDLGPRKDDKKVHSTINLADREC